MVVYGLLLSGLADLPTVNFPQDLSQIHLHFYFYFGAFLVSVALLIFWPIYLAIRRWGAKGAT